MLKYNFILVLSTLLHLGYAVKLCVPEVIGCDSVDNLPLFKAEGLQCIVGRDRLDCLQKIKEGECDVTVTSDYETYLAHLLYGNFLSVIGESRTVADKTNRYRYEGVAVIRKSEIKTIDDLRNARSCHTGYWRTAGWHMPVAMLRTKGMLKRNCDPQMTVVEHDLYDVSNFFKSACVPGPWAPDAATDAKLKEKYPSLCDLCGSEGSDKCTVNDKYTGYSGALQCLVDGGSVGWSKYTEVEKFFNKLPQSETEKFGLLCPNNVIIENVLASHQEVTSCAWAGRPWSAWIVRSEDRFNTDLYSTLSKVLESISVSSNPAVKSVFGVNQPSTIERSETFVIKEYLQNANYLQTLEKISCPNVPPVSLCVESDDAFQKCSFMSRAMEASRVRPLLRCIKNDVIESCLARVASTPGFVTVVDGADVYFGHKELDIKPIISEKYGIHNASYYAVAVVRKSSGINDLKDVKGLKSCHTGMDKTSGWKMPVAALLEAGLLPAGDCNYAKTMAQVFSQSCVPGAKSTKYDKDGTNPDSLCELCIGDGETSDSHCARNSKERYYSYSGAFRCLADGKGDIAFVKHSTIFENSDDSNRESWARSLKSEDFKLLCGKGGSAQPTQYEECNLEQVPAHKVVIGPTSSSQMVEEARIMLLRASKAVTPDIFAMFGKYKGTKDLIFKDSTTELVDIPDDSFHVSLQKSYNVKLEELDGCGPIASTNGSNKETFSYSLYFVLMKMGFGFFQNLI